MSFSNRERLGHILDAIAKVRSILNGISKEQFLNDEVKISAVSYKLKKLSTSTCASMSVSESNTL